MKFKNRVVVVTGAAQGMGKDFAFSFAKEGATVALFDVNAEVLGQTANELIETGAKVLSFTVDITDEATVEKAMKDIGEQCGGIDFLINNAGLHMQDFNEVTKLSVERWRLIMDVNVIGQMICAKHARPFMVGREGASIVNQSSMSAYMSIGAYSISKLALIGLTTALAREFSGDGIRVNAIAPGLISTDATSDGMDKGVRDYVLGNQLIKRFGNTADIVSTVHYLCSPESSFMTGQTLRVDGGYVLHP